MYNIILWLFTRNPTNTSVDRNLCPYKLPIVDSFKIERVVCVQWKRGSDKCPTTTNKVITIIDTGLIRLKKNTRISL